MCFGGSAYHKIEQRLPAPDVIRGLCLSLTVIFAPRSTRPRITSGARGGLFNLRAPKRSNSQYLVDNPFPLATSWGLALTP